MAVLTTLSTKIRKSIRILFFRLYITLDILHFVTKRYTTYCKNKCNKLRQFPWALCLNFVNCKVILMWFSPAKKFS